jgi:beta-lactamase class A
MVTPPSHSDALIDDSLAAVDPARRLFLAGLGSLLVTALGVAPLSSEAARSRRNVPNNAALLRDFRTPSRSTQISTLAIEAEIERYIKNLRRAGRVKPDESTAWLVYDFTTRRYLVSINATRSHQSASMVKPFVALAFFHKVREGKLQYTSSHRTRMEAMIQRSDNSATNYFIDLLNRTSRRSGPAEVERTLKRYHPDIFRHTRIVERIPGGGRTYRNKASALDYHRFLYALWYNRLPYSRELKRLMNLPNRDRVYSGAHGVARQTWVLDKTGTTARLCGDMGILIAQGRNGRRYPYTFVGIIEKSRSAGNYKAWKDDRGDVIREVSSLAYAHLQRMHNLV